MRSPREEAESRLRARYHVQVEIEERRVDEGPTIVWVHCRVRRLFRGAGLGLGDFVWFWVVVSVDTGEKIPGFQSWVDRVAFENATYLEVFLDGDPPYCGVASGQCFVIERLSDVPQVTVPTEEELADEWRRYQQG